jgi:hypothetical protein
MQSALVVGMPSPAMASLHKYSRILERKNGSPIAHSRERRFTRAFQLQLDRALGGLKFSEAQCTAIAQLTLPTGQIGGRCKRWPWIACPPTSPLPLKTAKLSDVIEPILRQAQRVGSIQNCAPPMKVQAQGEGSTSAENSEPRSAKRLIQFMA